MFTVTGESSVKGDAPLLTAQIRKRQAEKGG